MRTSLFDAARRCALPVALLVLMSCRGEGPLAIAGDASSGQAELLFLGGLVQRVTLEPATPAADTDVRIRSVIVNSGSSSVVLELRQCGLDFGGTAELTWPPGSMKCMAYSGQWKLAPGDSVVGYDFMRVSSPPGEYELRVRHALEPNLWIPVPMSVR